MVIMKTYESSLYQINMAGVRLSATKSAPSRKCVINPRPSFLDEVTL